MFDRFKQALGFGVSVDFAALIRQGAQIVDVRTHDEFRGGHIEGSLNIPVQNLAGGLARLDREKPIITCCASGMRSATAKRMLEAEGFTAHNGGGWRGLQGMLR